ncbi:hypothetical protein PoB_000734900 [Plakobranchus ocellatus]|uniref:Uncharacterized protein n=1 Tax=Plakobranchus ocellatus TaxID=259542 RepID=A0AAV3YFL0_9GAST|nr:hypothetical protein PoB_000734900 [Plakobranchus ocellatus]
MLELRYTISLIFLKEAALFPLLGIYKSLQCIAGYSCWKLVNWSRSIPLCLSTMCTRNGRVAVVLEKRVRWVLLLEIRVRREVLLDIRVKRVLLRVKKVAMFMTRIRRFVM